MAARIALYDLRSKIRRLLRDTSSARWSDADINLAINTALKEAYPYFYTERHSDVRRGDMILVTDNRLEYPLEVYMPFEKTTPAVILAVQYSSTGEEYRGTVSSYDSDNYVITDENASWVPGYWTMPTGRSVLGIYRGTGAGFYAPVTSNTVNTVTVDSTLGFWPSTMNIYRTITLVNNQYDTGVGENSQYVIADTRSCEWRELWKFDVDREEYPTVLYIPRGLPAGTLLRLHYITPPEPLVDDNDTTDVPEDWLMYQASATLHLNRLQTEPGWENSVDQYFATTFQVKADQIRTMRAMPYPKRTLRNEMYY